MLVATWFFAISTLPFVVYGVYAIAIEPTSYIGYVYVLASIFTFAGLGMWLVAGKTTTILFVSFRSAFAYVCCLGSCDTFFLYVFLHSLTRSCLLAALPENMVANGGTGSTIFYDRVFSQNWCCCGCLAPMVLKWAHTDMLAGMWSFFLLSASLFPFLVLDVIWYPTYLLSWLNFIMGVAFIAGAGLMVYTSYPQNFNSTVAFDTLTCYRAPKVTKSAA